MMALTAATKAEILCYAYGLCYRSGVPIDQKNVRIDLLLTHGNTRRSRKLC